MKISAARDRPRHHLGGWRIIRTLGRGLVDITPRQGMASDGATASVLMAASHLGFALHDPCRDRVGPRRRPRARNSRALEHRRPDGHRRATTFPLAGLASAIMFWLGHSIGGIAGALVVFAADRIRSIRSDR